jgi:hypothetical protein
MSFEKARHFIRKLGLITIEEFRTYSKSSKCPENIPKNPDKSYQNDGWVNWGDWLGTGRVANADIEFKSFEEAKKFVHKLNLKTTKEWQDYCKSGDKPSDIPSVPSGTYKKEGWKGMGDWLGTGRIADKDKIFLGFKEARAFARKLKLKSSSEWNHYVKSGNKPEEIPSAPNYQYKNNGWSGYGDWLGTGRVADHLREYREFKEARKFARSLGLKNISEWLMYCRSGNKPQDIPSIPAQTYKEKGWNGVGDWLGVKTHLDKDFFSFEKAKSEVKKLGIKSMKEWREYYNKNKPEHLPAAPDVTYKDSGWKDFGDFFGTGAIAHYKKRFRDFQDARQYVRKLNLKSTSEWRDYCKSGKKPYDISGSPHNTYKNEGWISYGDWLGTGRIADGQQNWRTFNDARKFAQGLNLTGKEQWMEFAKSDKKPLDIPTTVNRVYKNEWKGWGDFIGTSTDYVSYNEAKLWVQKNKIKSSREYIKVNRPANFPRSPHLINQWKDQWKGWADFLGKE